MNIVNPGPLHTSQQGVVDSWKTHASQARKAQLGAYKSKQLAYFSTDCSTKTAAGNEG